MAFPRDEESDSDRSDRSNRSSATDPDPNRPLLKPKFHEEIGYIIPFDPNTETKFKVWDFSTSAPKYFVQIWIMGDDQIWYPPGSKYQLVIQNEEAYVILPVGTDWVSVENPYHIIVLL